MVLRFLDVVVPTFDGLVRDLVEDNLVGILLLLIGLLLVCAVLVSVFVIRKNKPKAPEKTEGTGGEEL